ncbi:uncharacterized protein LOC135050707 [Pseudophryne corroboree]|uniref:uncharacterized protein LOC135050707 n=1 Tax=Pseudophryne corroboree TaxID=495146 RepID=UPI00308190A2
MAKQRMDSRRWMDLDGSWVYSTSPVSRQTDNHLKYSTLPGGNLDRHRADADVSGRPGDDRGKYCTIPGRFVSREPEREQNPYRLWTTSRLPQSMILQDSTNWDPNAPPQTRKSTIVRMTQNADTRTDARVRDRIHYEWNKDISRRKTLDQERKRQKLQKEAHADMLTYSPSTKRRHKGKLVQMDSFYGGWEPHYTLDNKVKVAKYEEWEPLARPPKALQTHSEPMKEELPHSEKTKSLMASTKETTLEKKRWWSKLVKPSKSRLTNAISSEVLQDKTSKLYMEQGPIMNHCIYKQEGFKENWPQIRKRKGPPPYVPPPSYDYPHRIFPINKEKLTHSRESNQSGVIHAIILKDDGNCQERREKMARYSVERPKASKVNILSIPNVRENRVEEKLTFDSTYQNIMQGRTLPQAHGTWPGSKSDDLLDHIYEIVEGGGIPLTTNLPTFRTNKSDVGLQIGEMIYETVSIPAHGEPLMPYTLPRTSSKGIHNENETTRRKTKSTVNRSQRQMPPFDARLPIPLNGVKLPRELGFSYTSGKLKSMDKRTGEDYRNIKESDHYEPGHEWRRPLRVIANTESKARGPSNSLSNKGKYSWHSHTLPLKKNLMKTYKQEEISYVDSRNQIISSRDADFLKWREPEKICTFPGRGHNQNQWRHEDGLRPAMKPDPSRARRSEPSATHNHEEGPRIKPKEAASEKMQHPLSKESDGMFVIDATCVVVRAEYIFPPIMEQVTFLHTGTSKGDILFNKVNSTCFDKNEKISNLSSHPKPFSNLTLKTCSQKTHSKAQHCTELSKEKVAPNLKERAIRILGLSVGELESLNEIRDYHKINSCRKEAGNADQEPGAQEQECEVHNKNPNGNNNRKESKIRNYKEMPCILEVADLPAVSSGVEDHSVQMIGQQPLDNNATIDIDEAEQKILNADIHNKNIIEPSNIKLQHVENPATAASEENSDYVQELKHQSSSLMEVDSCLVEGNSIDVTTSPGRVSDYMKTETAMKEQLLEDMGPNPDEQPCITPTKTLECQVPEKQGQAECMLVDTKKEEGHSKGNDKEERLLLPMNTKEQHPTENQGQVESTKCAKAGPGSAGPAECSDPDHPYLPLSRQRDTGYCVNRQTDQTSPQPMVRTYTRRLNYYAKDLREAVSRIRRHTAPDSDTDEDLEQPVCDSVKSEEHLPDECGTSCSSDTSDSEVTVILCEAIKEEETVSMSDVSEGTNGQSRVESYTLDYMAAESTLVALQYDEMGEESYILQEPEQEPVFDLSSCIDEILQDLNKTKQEFFPNEEDN